MINSRRSTAAYPPLALIHIAWIIYVVAHAHVCARSFAARRVSPRSVNRVIILIRAPKKILFHARYYFTCLRHVVNATAATTVSFSHARISPNRRSAENPRLAAKVARFRRIANILKRAGSNDFSSESKHAFLQLRASSGVTRGEETDADSADDSGRCFFVVA